MSKVVLIQQSDTMYLDGRNDAGNSGQKEIVIYILKGTAAAVNCSNSLPTSLMPPTPLVSLFPRRRRRLSVCDSV